MSASDNAAPTGAGHVTWSVDATVAADLLSVALPAGSLGVRLPPIPSPFSTCSGAVDVA